ncbi:hypothetical protein ACHAAC_02400 [Aeromicrobium sp. CF4.19]|uniref:hypothetical protein n=1 Tax=Aeromicrobium sp. CF4.19 TaxID=3373082 RepID=UPI003EE5DC9E
MTRGALSSLVLAAVAALVLGACGGGGDDAPEVEPIEIVTPPDGTGEPIDLDLPADPSGAFELERWPSACELVSEETVKAIFPQAEGLDQDPTAQQIQIINITPDGEARGPQTVPEADCRTRVGFSQEGLGLSDGVVVLEVASSVQAAGEAEFVERNAQETAGEDVELAGAPCTLADDGRTYQCNVGQVVFTMTIDMRQYAQYVGTDGSEYTVDGEAMTFSGQDPAFDAVGTDQVLTPLASAAVDRLG